MLRNLKNVVLSAVLVCSFWLSVASPVQAQVAFAHLTFGGVTNRFNLSLDPYRANNVFINIAVDRVDMIINGEAYVFSGDYEIGEYLDDNDALFIVDGDYPSTIIINGSTLPFRITVYGQGGNDYIQNNTGNRCDFRGGTGDDTLRGGSNNDWMFGGPGDDDLFGEGGNDKLLGGGGQDLISGGGGADELYGNLDAFAFGKHESKWDDNEDDTLIGGSGPDRFFWATYYYRYSGQYSVKRYHEKDSIIDFQQGIDFKREIYLPRYLFGRFNSGGYSYR